jgi:hypothetical protein
MDIAPQRESNSPQRRCIPPRQIARPWAWTAVNDDFDVRGLQGVPDERLFACGYTTMSRNVVEAIGFFTGSS